VNVRLGSHLILIASLYACGGMRLKGSPEQVVVLDVRNHSFFDVNVFALPSPASETRVRLGNVTGFATVEFRVPLNALRQRQSLVLYLHAIGSNRSWTSPEVLVSPSVRPCLDIHSDLAGNLGMSVLYSRVAPDSGENGHCGYPRVSSHAPLSRAATTGSSPRT
jgi:hypothetical protein